MMSTGATILEERNALCNKFYEKHNFICDCGESHGLKINEVLIKKADVTDAEF